MKSILRALALAATLLLSAAASAHEGHLPWTDATVKKVEDAAGRITLAHGRIANLDMPPMTMMFKVKDAAMLKKVKAGDKVRFRVAEVGGALTVLSIEPAK
jgi:Cu/Ag efflux protein CusF